MSDNPVTPEMGKLNSPPLSVRVGWVDAATVHPASTMLDPPLCSTAFRRRPREDGQGDQCATGERRTPARVPKIECRAESDARVSRAPTVSTMIKRPDGNPCTPTAPGSHPFRTHADPAW
ncbi:hypothetical protein KRMM14A1004_17820 [Krasilnikovia sp. MM14-A1004]